MFSTKTNAGRSSYTLDEFSVERNSRTWLSNSWNSCLDCLRLVRRVEISSAVDCEHGEKVSTNRVSVPSLCTQSSFSLLTILTRSRFSLSTSSTRVLRLPNSVDDALWEVEAEESCV